jgi:hypothetical protein
MIKNQNYFIICEQKNLSRQIMSEEGFMLVFYIIIDNTKITANGIKIIALVSILVKTQHVLQNIKILQ